MGGFGSGRHWRPSAKGTTDAYQRLDVRHLQRKGLLERGRSFTWQWSRDGETLATIDIRTEPDQVILSYRHRLGEAEWKREEYPVRLEWTPCAYGGRRAWFICPAQGCGRRVAILYCGAIFACRHCYQLAYPCQRETNDDRVMRRAERIRHRLGWEPGIMNPDGSKPKGMHWRTFVRLQAEHNRLVWNWLAGSMERFGLLQKHIDKMMDRLSE